MVMEEQELDMELASESIPVPQVQEPIIDAIKRNKSGVSRKPRLRKKALYASILKQMEFYFSDANLSKDRYLSGLLKNGPYVDLSEFVKFNKLSELTTDINRIAKALQGSTMLKVSEDGTKVCRTTPIKKKENVDECTVYVQNLPPDADHEWLESIFSKYGRVDYISIPRYKSNKKIKGFAFVEFDTPTSAQECIKIFREKGCVLPSYTSPNDLLSIATFDDPKKDHTIVGKIDEMKLNDNNKEEIDKTDEMDTTDNNDKLRKRKFPAEKSFEKESDVIVKKKKKEKTSANQNIDRENEKEAVLEDETKDSDDIYHNEKDNSSKQSLKKRKTSGKFIAETEDNDNIHNNKKDTVDNNKQNPKKKKGKSIAETEDNDNSHNSEKNTVNNSKQNLRKRRLTSGKSVPETEDNDTHNNETDTMDNNSKQQLRKKKLTSEKCITESDPEVNNITNSNVEIEESPNINSANNKSPEKKKRRLTINDTIEDINKEMIKKDSHVLATKSSKCKGKESEYSNKSVGEHESDAALQTEKHSVMKNVEMKSDVEEKELNGNERKKKRNRKQRNKMQEDFDNTMILQVMAKPEWKHLRNRYLDLQRTKMSQLKQHLRKAKVERGEMMRNRWNYDKVGQNYEKSKYEKDNYDKSNHEKDNEKINEADNSSSGRVSYAPGIIVKIEMDEPCTDPQSFKMELRENNSLQYIDITQDSCEAYVRCITSEAAQSFAQKDYEGRRLTVLKDDEEKSYWDKIARDRAEKLSRKDKKQRGRNKLLKRAEKQLGKCIKFDED